MKMRSRRAYIGRQEYIKFNIKLMNVDNVDPSSSPIYETFVVISCTYLNMSKTDFLNSLEFKDFYKSLNNSSRRYFDYSEIKNKLVKAIITCPTDSEDFIREYFGFLDCFGVLILVPDEVVNEIIALKI